MTANDDEIDTECTFVVEGGVSLTDVTLQISGGATTIGGELSLESGSDLDLIGGGRDRWFVECRWLHGLC